MVMSFICEQIAFSEDYEKDNGFYISVKNLSGREIDRKELAIWGLTKSLSCCLIIRTEKSNFGNLEQPTVPELYKVNLDYSVNKSAKSLYLKKETQTNSQNDSKVLRIFLKDVNNGVTQQLPILNDLYKDEFDISITKSKGELITLKDTVKLLKDGDCLGLFDSSLTKMMLI